MAAREEETGLGAARVLDADEVQGVLSGAFYSAEPRPRARKLEPKPAHYKVICISLYNGDLARLDGLVETLKARGVTKANRSALIRVALEQLDIDKVPRGL
ncbi:MAG TPA: hypothetical protein VHV30_12415 [Polyangiaceae bacterium]|jgi:hypothetical protein|nr:hypothetical protein [Polyangiaceae bacterium]